MTPGAPEAEAGGARRRRERRARERAGALVFVGALTLSPALAGFVPASGLIVGLPAPLVYVFAIWAAMVLGAGALALHAAFGADRDG